jgi:hypothetical protein
LSVRLGRASGAPQRQHQLDVVHAGVANNPIRRFLPCQHASIVSPYAQRCLRIRRHLAVAATSNHKSAGVWASAAGVIPTPGGIG